MSELTHSNAKAGDLRWQLLTTASALALITSVIGQGAQAGEDADRPTVWVELGGQLERIDTSQAVFAPDFVLKHETAPYNTVSPLTAQRLPRYGFGGEGDWKTSALLRLMKVIAADLSGGTSFMEDYTYHLAPEGHLVLGAHMLEICESIAAGRPALEVHPLGIGGKEDPVRLVFDAHPGAAAVVEWAHALGIDYLYVDDLDRVTYPNTAKFDAAPQFFRPAFRAGNVAVYEVR